MNLQFPDFIKFTDTAAKIAEYGTRTLKHTSHKSIIDEDTGAVIVAQYVGGEMLMTSVSWMQEDGTEILSRHMTETGEFTHMPLNPEKTKAL